MLFLVPPGALTYRPAMANPILSTAQARVDRLDLPAALVWHAGRPIVTIKRVAVSALRAPFWDDAVLDGAIVGLVPLDDVDDRDADLGIAGFIHHLWRCGSTLMVRQFAAVPGTAGISEPTIFEELVNQSPDGEQLPRRLRRLAGLLRDAMRPVAERLVIKWSGGMTRHSALLSETFPDIPAVFLHRDPVEVLQSIRARPLGFPAAQAVDGPGASLCGELEKSAFLIAQACEGASRARALRRIDYRAMPDATIDRVAPFFGFRLGAAAIVQMRQAAVHDAKVTAGAAPFLPDGAAKRKAADDEVRALAARVVAPSLAKAMAALMPL